MIRAFAIFILLALAAPAWAVEVDAINGIPISKLKAINGVSITKIKAWNGFAIASALTCTSYVTNSTGSSAIAFARYNGVQYYGLRWDDGSSGSICSIKFFFLDNTGDIGTKDFYFEVWLLDGSGNLDTLAGRSDKVDGDDTWSAEIVDFAFSTPAAYDCTGSNQYGILIKAIANDAAASTAGEFDESIYARSRYSDETNNMTGCVSVGSWNSGTGAISASHDADDMPIIEIWTMQ